MAERKHQCVASQKLSVETQLQKEPVVVFTHTVVYPEKIKRKKHGAFSKMPYEDHEGKSQLFKIHIYSASVSHSSRVRQDSRGAAH